MNKILNFQMAGKLILGPGAVAELPTLIRELGCSKVLIVTDPGLVKVGHCDTVSKILTNDGIRYDVFDGVEPDPPIEVAVDCLQAAKKGNYDILVGLGGGSSMDIAKIVSVLIKNDGDVTDYVGIGKIPKPGIPKIMIPTTAGTGSEVTPIVVLSDKKEHLKKGVVSDHNYPTVALVDPELTQTLPADITGYTGIDTLAHAVESYTNKFAQPFIDTFALQAIRLVGRNLSRAVHHGDDSDARYNMAMAGVYGGLCLGSVNTTAVHALAYPLGGTYNVPHGIANSLLLPYVMEFNLPSNIDKYATIAEALGVETSGLSPEEAAAQSVEAVKRLSKEVGVVTKMRELDIPEDAIASMAEAALKVTRLLNNNPRDVGLEDAKQIYRNAY